MSGMCYNKFNLRKHGGSAGNTPPRSDHERNWLSMAIHNCSIPLLVPQQNIPASPAETNKGGA